MKFSCDTCPAKGIRCDGCMMSVLAHPVFATITQRETALDAEDLRVLDVLVGSGLVDSNDAGAAQVENIPVRHIRAVS